MLFLCLAVVLFNTGRTNGLSFHSFGNEFEYIATEMNESLVNFDTSAVKTSWMRQPVNHFDPIDTRTWKMRYFQRHDMWKPKKPIYLFLGGEGPASPVFLKTGIMYDLANETNGAMFASEHRYYGKSKPFQNFTSENLAYLSARQALADSARLLKLIKSMPKFRSSKVVVVGGSYSGNLAAWMKLLYPELVDAAIASSAPVLAKKYFYEYLETVSDDFEQYGPAGCWDKIAAMFSRYEKLFQSDDGIETLKVEENICDSCDMSKSENRELFFMEKASQFMYRAQYGNPGVIKDYCESNFTSNFRKVKNQNLIWNERSECYYYDFDEMIVSIRSIDWLTAWIYQTCTEFGYFQTGSSDDQPFTKNISVEFYYRMCTKLFGPDFNEERVDRGVRDSNKLYGGLKPNVSHVVFVNGDMDPWSRLSVLEDLSYESPAKIISQSSHCRDLFSDRESDHEELKDARAYIRYLIKDWIGEGNYKKP
ncbi:putative serine protease K12H4.7 [Ostrinia furnacalis]|uniref:putative serine protease K12H4.7 n=1 Tax=Ostrinia furnacalis TaxID=93504 RepID=UPI00103D4A01|nr:putative serine protease K12H4.7 [Ostrinia furnacalis]